MDAVFLPMPPTWGGKEEVLSEAGGAEAGFGRRGDAADGGAGTILAVSYYAASA